MGFGREGRHTLVCAPVFPGVALEGARRAVELGEELRWNGRGYCSGGQAGRYGWEPGGVGVGGGSGARLGGAHPVCPGQVTGCRRWVDAARVGTSAAGLGAALLLLGGVAVHGERRSKFCGL